VFLLVLFKTLPTNLLCFVWTCIFSSKNLFDNFLGKKVWWTISYLPSNLFILCKRWTIVYLFIYLIYFAPPSFSPLKQCWTFLFLLIWLPIFFSFLELINWVSFFPLCLLVLSPLKWMDNFIFSLSTSFFFWNRRTIYCCCETKKVIC